MYFSSVFFNPDIISSVSFLFVNSIFQGIRSHIFLKVGWFELKFTRPIKHHHFHSFNLICKNWAGLLAGA